MEHPCEVQCFVVLPTSYATTRFKAEHLLEAVQVFSLDQIESKSDRYHNENALVLVDLFQYLVQENIAIVAHYHAEIRERLSDFVQFV